MPAGVHNGSSVIEPKRGQVVIALASGESVKSISQRLRLGYNTVVAVRDAEWCRVEARKPLLAAQAERGAILAGDKIVEAVANGDIKGAALIPAYGVFVDKALALRGDPTLTVKHEHTHTHQVELVSALNNAVEKLAKVRVVEQPRLTDRPQP